MAKAPTRSKTAKSRARPKPSRNSSPAKAPVAAASKAAEPKDDGRAQDAKPVRGPVPNPIPEIVGTNHLSEFLGYSDRRIQQMVKDGILRQVSKGKYSLREAVQAIITYARETEVRKSAETSGDRLKETRRQEVERKMAREDRSIIALDEAVDGQDILVGFFVETLDSLPARLTRDQSERAKLQTVLDQVRTDLAKRVSEAANLVRQGRSPSSAD